MKYAIVTSGGKQYKVIQGQVVEIDKIKADVGDKYAFEHVLMTVDDATVQIGTPYLSNVAVSGKVQEQIKGDKIRVAKFKAKARYRKVQGFRALKTKIEITELSVNNSSKSAPTK